MPITLASHFYAIIALSTLSFVAQFEGVSEDTCRMEDKPIASLLHIPCRSLPWPALLNLAIGGGQRWPRRGDVSCSVLTLRMGFRMAREAGITEFRR